MYAMDGVAVDGYQNGRGISMLQALQSDLYHEALAFDKTLFR